MLLEGTGFAALGGRCLRRALGVVVEAGQDVARRSRLEVLGLFALDGLFAGGLVGLNVSMTVDRQSSARCASHTTSL